MIATATLLVFLSLSTAAIGRTTAATSSSTSFTAVSRARILQRTSVFVGGGWRRRACRLSELVLDGVHRTTEVKERRSVFLFDQNSLRRRLLWPLRSHSTSTEATIEKHSSSISQKTRMTLDSATEDVAAETTPALTMTSKNAQRVSTSPSSLAKCAERLRAGDLVAFPTETVYGLGGHALDAAAVGRIFAAKERPSSDPLIVHVLSKEQAYHLWHCFASPEADTIERRVLQLLTAHFWPGPLTIVALAAASIPDAVTASTGYVGCRVPAHPVARALLETVSLPIAAPSANKFGHVSPTKANHVMTDLGKEDVWVLDPTMESETTQAETELICNVGVESTVAKVEMMPGLVARVTILRHGAISAADMRQCLDQGGLHAVEVCEMIKATKTDVSHVAPGQTIRHYAPNVAASYMISRDRWASDSVMITDEERQLLRKAVVIDFGGRLAAWEAEALAYQDLSPVGNSTQAAAAVFETLRWAETVEAAERVYFPELIVAEKEKDQTFSQDALSLAVKDRLTRAASGVVIHTLR